MNYKEQINNCLFSSLPVSYKFIEINEFKKNTSRKRKSAKCNFFKTNDYYIYGSSKPISLTISEINLGK